jgi:hypothetical protein
MRSGKQTGLSPYAGTLASTTVEPKRAKQESLAKKLPTVLFGALRKADFSSFMFGAV